MEKSISFSQQKRENNTNVIFEIIDQSYGKCFGIKPAFTFDFSSEKGTVARCGYLNGSSHIDHSIAAKVTSLETLPFPTYRQRP